MTDENKTAGALASFMGATGLPAIDKKAAAQALAQSADAGSSSGGDVDYLSFSGKKGTWAVGRDKVAPDPESVYIIDPYAGLEGWTCWKGGTVAEKHQWSPFEREMQGVAAASLKDHGPYGDGDGWSFMLGLGMADLDEPTKMIQFSTTSKSGRNAVGDLQKEMIERMMSDEPDMPIISLGSVDFTAHGKVNSKPVFETLSWVTREEFSAFLNSDDMTVDELIDGEAGKAPAPEPEPAPKKRRRAAA